MWFQLSPHFPWGWTRLVIYVQTKSEKEKKTHRKCPCDPDNAVVKTSEEKHKHTTYPSLRRNAAHERFVMECLSRLLGDVQELVVFGWLRGTLGVVLIVFERVIVTLAVLDEAVGDVGFSEAPLEIFTLIVLVTSKGSCGVHLEPIDTGFITATALLGIESRVNLEQDRMERGTKVRAING